MDTLALGYVIPAIRAHSGLAPVRQRSCRAYREGQPMTAALVVYGCPAKNGMERWLTGLVDKTRCVLNGDTKQAFVGLHVAEDGEAEVFVRRATEAA